MLVAVLAFIGVFVYALQLEKNNKPPQDMKDGFSAGEYSPFGTAEESGGGTQNTLEVQHLGTRDVARMLTEIVTEALSFNKSTFAGNTAAVKKYFTPEGYAQYTAFLQTAGLQQALTAQDLRSGVLIDNEPLELSHGVSAGAFKWLFEVPVTLSFMPASARNYDGSNATMAQNRKFILRAQFTRVKDANDPDAIKIEIWQVLPPRRS